MRNSCWPASCSPAARPMPRRPDCGWNGRRTAATRPRNGRYKKSGLRWPQSASRCWPMRNYAARLLLWAAKRNDAALTRDLAGGAGVDSADDFGTSALSEAAAAGAVDSLGALLEARAKVDAADHYGTTPLMRAASQSDARVTAVLLAHGANPTLTDSTGNTALMYAARANRTQQIAPLIAAGAAIQAVNLQGWSALDVALRSNAAETAAELRERGAKAQLSAPTITTQAGIDYSRSASLYRGWSPLFVAISRDDVATVNRLLESGVDANSRAPDGDTTVLVAAHSNAIKTLAVLLKHGARIRRVAGASGETPLAFAAGRDMPAVLRELLAAGVSPDVHAAKEAPPLVIAAGRGTVRTIEALVGAKAAIDAADSHGGTALMVVAAMRRLGDCSPALVVRRGPEHQESFRSDTAVDCGRGRPRRPGGIAVGARRLDRFTGQELGHAVDGGGGGRSCGRRGKAAGCRRRECRKEPHRRHSTDIGRRRRSTRYCRFLAAAAFTKPLNEQNNFGDPALIAASRGGFAEMSAAHCCAQAQMPDCAMSAARPPTMWPRRAVSARLRNCSKRHEARARGQAARAIACTAADGVEAAVDG